MPGLLSIFKTIGLPEYNDKAIEDTADKIVQQLDTRTAVKDLERLWNRDLLSCLEIEKGHPEHLEYTRIRRDISVRRKLPYDKQEHFYIVPKIYFRVLDKVIQPADTVALAMPQGPLLLFMVGWRLSKGTLQVTGTVGALGYEAYGTAHFKLVGDVDGSIASHAHGQTTFDVIGNITGGVATRAYDNVRVAVHGNARSPGEGIRGTVHCTIYGNAEHVGAGAGDNTVILVTGDVGGSEWGAVGMNAWGNAQIHIKGNVKGDVGRDAGDNAHIVVDGDVGDYAGYGITQNVFIEVGGNAGKNLGLKAQGNTRIEVHGNAGKRVGHRAYRNAQIIVDGSGESGTPNPSFKGLIMINGQTVHTPTAQS